VKQPTAETIRLLGGALCLDFANTTEWQGAGTPLPHAFDVLAAPDGLVSWGRRLGLLSDADPVASTARDVKASLDLRAALHEIFASIASGGRPRPDALDQLHKVYAEAARRATIRGHGGRWSLTWPEDDARSVRLAVAANAVTLLAEPERLNRVRECPGRNCGGLFLDASGRRRWCSMEICGSRAKMRRLYERQRAAAHGAPVDGAANRAT
jgi:predicted RNA-binding Zn ribbon-like protein